MRRGSSRSPRKRRPAKASKVPALAFVVDVADLDIVADRHRPVIPYRNIIRRQQSGISLDHMNRAAQLVPADPEPGCDRAVRITRSGPDFLGHRTYHTPR